MRDTRLLADAAMGRAPLDLVFKNGKIVDVFTGSIIEGDVAIKDGLICGVGEYSAENEIDVKGKYIMPGFIDSHLHIESSMVTPAEYMKAAFIHGVTTIIADPHEIANVCGEAGLKYMKDAAGWLPIKYMLPSCVPASPFEHAGAVIDHEDIKRLAPEFFGLGEMMNYPGIVGGDRKVHKRLVKHYMDGHAPLVSGRELDAYAGTGIRTDHECTDINEMNEKISKGMYIAVREGTLSKDIEKLVKGITPRTAKRCMFCTDDRFIGEIYKDGSIDYCIGKAVKLGLDPMDAIAMATINAAECYGLEKRGAVAPGRAADLVIAADLCASEINLVVKDGEIVARNGAIAVDMPEVEPSDAVLNTVHIPKKAITPKYFAYNNHGDELDAIELIPHSIVTKKVRVKYSDSLTKACVIERHNKLGTKGFAYITNYGIKNAAIAMSIGHDSHNIIVLGDNDAAMAKAVNALGRKGGIALAREDEVLAYLKLDIGGIMSSKGAKEVIEEHDKIYRLCRELGVTEGIDPFLAPAFLPLPVIPEIRVTDSGLFDVGSFEFIGGIAEGSGRRL